MKNSIKIAVATLLAGSFILASCGKYEEGPSVSIRTKKGRVKGSWELEAYLENGTDKTNDYRTVINSETYTYEKDGTMKASVTTPLGTTEYEGTWEFINDKEDLKTTITKINGTAVTNDPDTTHLTRLTNKEMWSKETSGSDTYEYHMKSK
jgi:hypothetical protein